MLNRHRGLMYFGAILALFLVFFTFYEAYERIPGDGLGSVLLRILAGLAAFVTWPIGVAALMKLEEKLPPYTPSQPGRVAALIARWEDGAVDRMERTDRFWARVQAHPAGKAIVWIASAAMWAALAYLVGRHLGWWI
jgi:hypothetical protein